MNSSDAVIPTLIMEIEELQEELAELSEKYAELLMEIQSRQTDKEPRRL